MENYTVVNADFVEVINTTMSDKSLVAENKRCHTMFVEVIKHTTDKSLEGSSMRQTRGIKVKAFSNVSCYLKPNMNMIIGNVPYGNLEVTPIANSRQYVHIEGWA